MSATPKEVQEFKATLAKTSVEIIQKRLDEGAFMRDWKEQLAREEIQRRKPVTQPKQSPKDQSKRKLRASIYSWLIAVLLTALVLLAGWAAMD